MEIKRKIEIMVVTNRRYVIRQAAPQTQIRCAECRETMLTAEQSANFFGVTQRHVFRVVEAEAVHYAETEAGAVMICLNSLAAFLQNNGRK